MTFFPKKLNKSQLRSILDDYMKSFPHWERFDYASIIRINGPIRQMIWFEALRTGDYRPICGISALPLPIARMLQDMLDVRNRQSSLKQHKVRMPNILNAMKEQFKPDISKSMDIEEVLKLCEAEAKEMPDTTNNMVMLAILHAWLGHKSDTLECCGRMQHCSLPKLAPIPEWEESMRIFGRDLADAIRADNARPFLEEAIVKQHAA